MVNLISMYDLQINLTSALAYYTSIIDFPI